MCGIVGYVGNEAPQGIIIEGLKKLEYRGYDSAGIAVVNDGKIKLRKHVGEIVNLEKLIGKRESRRSCGYWTHEMGNSRCAI